MCVLISLAALAEEAIAAAEQKKIEETAAMHGAHSFETAPGANVTSDCSRRRHLEHEPSRTTNVAEQAV